MAAVALELISDGYESFRRFSLRRRLSWLCGGRGWGAMRFGAVADDDDDIGGLELGRGDVERQPLGRRSSGTSSRSSSGEIRCVCVCEPVRVRALSAVRCGAMVGWPRWFGLWPQAMLTGLKLLLFLPSPLLPSLPTELTCDNFIAPTRNACVRFKFSRERVAPFFSPPCADTNP